MIKQSLALLVAALVPACVYAVDGQVLINQAAVNAAGGFPFVISSPGSYKLSGNLVLTDSNKTAIRIATDFVTLDLGGFSIIGPNDCSSGACSANGTGNGIDTLANHVYFNITIRNGTIQGMGNDGIVLTGDSFQVESLDARSNGLFGILLQRFVLSSVGGQLMTVQHCNAELNFTGISIEGGQVNNNNSSRNRGSGIFNAFGTSEVNHNVLVGNQGAGIGSKFGGVVTCTGNVLKGNDFSDALGCVNLGQNFCGTAVCAAAGY